MAFAIAAQAYIFSRPIFTAGSTTIEIPRADLGPLELTHRNRAYYYFVLFVLVLVLLLVGHLKRTGIGRMIIGVRENELGASAMTVSPARAKLLAFAMGGFIAGLGGVLLGAVNLTFAPAEQHYFLVDDSLRLIAIVVIGGLGSLSGAVLGAVWVIGLPAFWPSNTLVPLFTSSIGLLIILLYIPGGFVQIGYYARDSLLRWVDKRMGPVDTTKTVTAPPASLRRETPLPPASLNTDGTVLATEHLTVRFGGLTAVDGVEFRAMPGEVIGLIGNNGAGKSTLLNAIGGYVPAKGTVQLLGRDVGRKKAHQRARLGLGRTFQAAKLYPELTVRDTVQLRARGARVHVVLGFVVVGAVDPPGAQEVRRGRRAHRLPRPRPLRGPLRRRAVDRHPADRRVGDRPRGGTARHLPRRADGRCRATRGRGVRSAHPAASSRSSTPR